MAVRRERVILELNDSFTPEMMKAVAATRLLNAELNRLSGQSVQTSRGTVAIHRDLDQTAVAAQRADRSINQLTGRLRLFADIAAILGPSLAPIGAVAIPAVTGLANQFGVAAMAAGTAVIAFQGVGDALKAVNDAALDPSITNLEKAREALEKLSPAAREFVTAMQAARPMFASLRDAAASGLFPGLTASLDHLEDRVPELQVILRGLGDTLGDLVEGGAAALAGSEWDQFFSFMQTSARDTLSDLGKTVGNLTRGMAEMWMAFAPLNNDFSDWLLRISRDFAAWSDGLSQTQGFADFVAYVRENGSQVAATFKALGDAVLQIVEASAPLGGPVLKALEAVAKVVASIADSDLGTPFIAGLAALSAYNRALAITSSIQGRIVKGGLVGGALAGATGSQGGRRPFATLISGLTNVTTAQERAATSAGQLTRRQQELRTGMAQLGKSAAVLAGLGVAASGAADNIGLTNTVSLGLLGTLGGFPGVIGGAAVGAVMDISASVEQYGEVADRAKVSLEALAAAGPTAESVAQLAALSAEIAKARDSLMIGTDLKNAGLGDKIGGTLKEIGSLPGMLLGGDDYATQVRNATRALEEQDAAVARLQDSWARDNDMRQRNALAAAAQSKNFDASRAAIRSLIATNEEFASSLGRLNDLLGNRASLRDYEAAVRALNETTGTWKRNTDEGAANFAKLDAVAGNAIKRASELKEQGKDLASVRVLQRAIKDIEQFTKDTPAAREAAADVLRELKKLANTKAKPEVKLEGADAAVAAARRVKSEMDNIKSIRRTITLNYQINRPTPNLSTDLGPGFRADGGTVPKTGLPYADRHLYMLADGEEVISNRRGQADRFRPLLKAINAAADGATVGASAALASSMFGASLPRGTDIGAQILAATSAFGFGLKAAMEQARLSAMSLGELKRAVSASEEALESERAKRDEIASAMDSLASVIEDKILQPLFSDARWTDGMDPAVERQTLIAQLRNQGMPAGWTSEMLAGTDLQTLRDLTRPNALGQAMDSLATSESQGAWLQKMIRRLSRKGLDGGALQALLDEGDLRKISDFADASRSELAAYERQWERTQALASSVGRAGADAAWGAALSAQTAVVRDLNRESKAQTKLLERMEDRLSKVEDAAARRGPDRIADKLDGISDRAGRGKGR